VSRTFIARRGNRKCILFWARICRWEDDIKVGLIVRVVMQ